MNILDLVSETFVDDEAPLPAVQVGHVLVLLPQVLRLRQVGHEAALDGFDLREIGDRVNGLRDAQQREVVSTHHSQFALESARDDGARDYRSNLVVVPIADVEVLLDLIHEVRILDLDEAFVVRPRIFQSLLIKDDCVLMLIANRAACRNAALCIDYAPIVGGIHLEDLIEVRFLIENQLRLVDPPTDHKLIDQVALKPSKTCPRLHLVLIHFIDDQFPLLRVQQPIRVYICIDIRIVLDVLGFQRHCLLPDDLLERLRLENAEIYFEVFVHLHFVNAA